MRSLNLGYLKLGLDDLLSTRAPLLLSCQSGTLYKPMLEAKQQQINALPESLLGKKPLAQELGDTDDTHDGAGNALWFICEAVLQSPLSTPEQTAAAQRVRKAMIPNRAIVKAAFPVEASQAKLNREKLPGLKADLESLPFPGGKTAYDMAELFVSSGEKLDTLLSGRATLEANVALREQVHGLRMQTLGLLGNFRSALQDELADNAGLPRNLEELIFGYLDELSAQRQKPEPKKGEGEGGGEGGGGGEK